MSITPTFTQKYGSFLNPSTGCPIEDEIDTVQHFQTEKLLSIPTTMSVGLEPYKTYSVGEIREEVTGNGCLQIWTLLDIDTISWRKIWAPPHL